MQVYPKNKWIVIEPREDAGMAGGIILPDSVNRDHKLATVVAAPYPKLEEVDLKEGDTIVYDSLGTVEVRIGEKKAFFVKAVNVMAVIK